MIGPLIRNARRSLRVAILHYACHPVLGGVEGIMSTHARLLLRAGYDAYLVAGRGDPGADDLPGVVIPELDSKHPGILEAERSLLAGETGSEAAFESWVHTICIKLEDALSGADACIVHNALTLHKNMALTAALARLAEQNASRRRWIAWCHDLAWTNPLYAGDLQPRWPWSLLREKLPNVTYVAISEQRRAELGELFGVPEEQIVLVPNGIAPESVLPDSAEMRALRDDLRWVERDWVFLTPVRVTRRKNLELGIDIMAAIRDKGPRPLLIVTGPPGPHNVRSSEYLDELLARRTALGLERDVVFLAVDGDHGRGLDVSDALRNELYFWSDALLLTSLQEGFGLPLLEAGLAHLPIFCSDLAVLREVGGSGAHYFRPGDEPAHIASGILEALEQPGVAAMRHRVRSSFVWDKIFDAKLRPLLEPREEESV